MYDTGVDTGEQLRGEGILPRPGALDDLVRRIVDAVQPRKIILFGSAARRQMKASSDIDLLVVKAGDYHHIEVAQQIYAALGRRDFAVDISVATPEEMERYGDEYSLVLYAAVHEGKVLYDAEAA